MEESLEGCPWGLNMCYFFSLYTGVKGRGGLVFRLEIQPYTFTLPLNEGAASVGHEV